MAEQIDTPFTPAETRILMSILQNLEGDLKFNANAVAAQCGLKDANIAKTRWRQIRNQKINPSYSPAGGVDKSTPSKKTPAKPKSAAVGPDGSPTPAKGKRGRKLKEADFDTNDDEALVGGVKVEEKDEHILKREDEADA